MSVLISELSIFESYGSVFDNGKYLNALNKVTFGFNLNCNDRLSLIKFLNAKSLSEAGIPVSTDDCKCLKKTLKFSQECE